MFRDDAFEPMRAGGPEEFLSVRLNLFREPDRPFTASEDRLQQQPALPLRQPPQVAAVEIKEIEGIKDDGACLIGRRQPPKGALQHAEIGYSLLHRAGGLAVEGGRRRATARCRRSQEIGSSNRCRRA